MTTSSAPNGSILKVAGTRPDLLSFEINGRIPVDDMEWMALQVESGFEGFEEIDMLLVMRRYDGADAGALIDPAVVKVQFRSLGKVRRYAVVGAPAWARAMIEAFDLVIPVDAKTFALEDEQEARRWVDEGSRKVSAP